MGADFQDKTSGRRIRNLDRFAETLKTSFAVIPAEAGIQSMFIYIPDSGSQRSDVFLLEREW